MNTQRKNLEWVLRLMARAVLGKYRPDIVGVTGSVGKSSTKDAIAIVLSSAFSVRKSEGNYNNELGVPLTILGVESGGRSISKWVVVLFKWLWLMVFPAKYPEVLVLEMGVDRPGDMSYLLEFIPLRVGVMTRIASSHIEFFGSLANITKEKGKLIASVQDDGFAVVNADDERAIKMLEKTKAKAIRFGFGKNADVRAEHIVLYQDGRHIEGTSFKMSYDGKTIPVRLPKIIAKHHLSAALAAAAVGIAFRLNLVQIAAALREFEPLPGRLRLLPGKNGTTIVDDTYNASPESVGAALEVLGGLSAQRKVAILGDMLELGEKSDEWHGELTQLLIDAGVTLFIGIGKHMRVPADRLLASGWSPDNVVWFPDPESAAEVALRYVQTGDLILLKGSRGMRLEKITERLLADRDLAREVLCCQTREWRSRPFSVPAEWKS